MTVVTGETEYLSLSEAAAALATTEMKILMLLKRKALEGRMVDDGWQVARSSLTGYDPNRDTPDREPHCSVSCSSARCGCR